MTSEQLDLAVWPIFSRMTDRGLRVDLSKLRSLREEVAAELDAQEAALEAFAGRALNPYSPDDVGAWLYGEGLAGSRRTRTGAVSTDERALSQLVDLHPVPGAVLECRGLRKLVGTFIDPTIAIAERHDSTVHPRWRLTRVKSGRPSMEDPNLLAFPTRDAWGKRVRDCFVARPGHLLISVDFSQVEIRVTAALSGDDLMRSLIGGGADMHGETAKRLFHIDADMSKEPAKTRYRLPAKTLTFGVLYGMTGGRLRDELIRYGCGTPSAPLYDESACEDLIRGWFGVYPKVKSLIDETTRLARAADGWVETRGGRKRFLPALLCDGRYWPAAKLREEAERQAFNHLIQGTAQEIMKEAMLRVGTADWLHPLLQIYDEMIYEVAEAEAGEQAVMLSRVMATRLEGVEIATSWSVGDSWGKLK